MGAYERNLQQDADWSYTHRERSQSHGCRRRQILEKNLKSASPTRGKNCPLRTLGAAFQVDAVARRSCPADVLLQQPYWATGRVVFKR